MSELAMTIERPTPQIGVLFDASPRVAEVVAGNWRIISTLRWVSIDSFRPGWPRPISSSYSVASPEEGVFVLHGAHLLDNGEAAETTHDICLVEGSGEESDSIIFRSVDRDFGSCQVSGKKCVEAIGDLIEAAAADAAYSAN